MSRRSAAVLGAGIMGSSTALHLARLGLRVTIFEREREPFRGASRWNEGRIHLGFVYANDPSLATARALLPGGLDFARQVSALTGTAVDGAVTEEDDVSLVHRRSVTDPETTAAYYERVAELVRAHPDAGSYLSDVSGSRVERLTRRELGSLADAAAVVAGFRIPERSVDTNRVADAFVGALASAPRVERAYGQTVTAVRKARAGRWHVHAGGDVHGPFDAVVNALWDGRPRIDRGLGHRPDRDEQHRYRVSVFARTAVDGPGTSAIVVVGPFGDVKRYSDRYFCASWYPVGLLARREAPEPPPVPDLDRSATERIAGDVFRELGAIIPAALAIRDAATELRVEGGWVYSQGRGALDDPRASVHRRDRLGVSRRGSYFSVDTGKYSVAPTLAEGLAHDVEAGAGRA